ncbi:MAG: hypothetical protein JNM27_11370 [Leptospirales bacterium]|nr:hypothetical protein [Leptospirales bacterium]
MKNESIDVVKCEPGLGKTEAVKRADIGGTCYLASDRYDLLDEHRGDFALFPRPDSEVANALDPFRNELGALVKLKMECQSNERMLKLIQDYEAECARVLNEPRIRLTTERLLSDRRLKVPELIIVDEDPTNATLKEGQVNLNYIRNCSRLSDMDERLDRVIKNFLSCDENKVYKREWNLSDSMDSFEMLVTVAGGTPDARNLQQLLWCDAFLKSGNVVSFITVRRLPATRVIILSATIEERLCRILYGDRIRLHEFPPVKPVGTLIQDFTKSYSKTSLEQDPAHMTAFLHLLHQKREEGYAIITHKSIAESGFVPDAHFGAATGSNNLQGRRKYLIAGTPNIPENTLRLRAAALGLKSESIRSYTKSQRRRVEYNGFEFFYVMLSEDPDIEALQLSYVETHLIQAAGRARYFEDECIVEVRSNFPLRGFDLR